MQGQHKLPARCLQAWCQAFPCNTPAELLRRTLLACDHLACGSLLHLPPCPGSHLPMPPTSTSKLMLMARALPPAVYPGWRRELVMPVRTRSATSHMLR